MKKSLMLTSLLISVLAFSGCGSDSDSDDGGSSSSGGGSVSLSWSPVANTVVCDPDPISYSDISVDAKYWAEGSVMVTCEQYGEYTMGVYGLRAGVDTLTITQLIKEEKVAYNTNVARGTGTVTYNYQAGTIHYNESSNVENVDCTETYASPLPFTLTEDNIDDLLDWEGESEIISTTCPDSWYEYNEYDDDDDDYDSGSGSGTIGTNYTLTDSDGNRHLLSVKQEFSF